MAGMRWFGRSRPRPAYAVDGVEPHRNEGWDVYAGEGLADQPVVRAAVDRLPANIHLDELPLYLSLGTADGGEWVLSIDETVRCLFDLSAPGTDVFEEHLVAQPWIDAVERVERDVFVLTVNEMLTVDVVLARCIDVCATVYRRLSP